MDRVTCPRCGMDNVLPYDIRVRNIGWGLCLLCYETLSTRLNRLLKTFFAAATARGEEWH